MSSHRPLPLYDLFLDIPHPAAATSCPPAFISGSPENNPEIEKELSANVSRISQFAFPDYDDSVDQRIPRDTPLNRFSQYAMQPKGFQNYTFSLQLQSGVRVHGFVRRYLPVHEVVEHRYDVGRRGERALVMLTRFSGGDLLYASILKTIDAMSSQKAALDSKYIHPEPQKWFLGRLYEEHQKLCRTYMSIPQEERKPMVISVGSMEVGAKSVKHLHQVDSSNYLVPTSLLAHKSSVEALTCSPILPLLRVLGVSTTLRLISAVLSENRVVLVSANATRLAQCARSVLSILAQGLLNWQHIYIPVLPPHLFQYLNAPVPYLMGILTPYMAKLNQMNSDALGELVIINLDTNQSETRGMNPMDVGKKIPDLFQKSISEQGMPASTMSPSEMLAQDLLDLLKMDKRALFGESTLTNVSETAAKATKAVKSGISNLAKKGKRFLKDRSKGSTRMGSSERSSEVEDEIETADVPDSGEVALTPDLVYIQGSLNEIAEEDARIAFSSFFLSMLGNMRWYLSASPGQLPHLDRNRYMQQKRAMGVESTPMWPLLENFCQSQMFEQFAKARVEEVRLRLPVTADSPLFTQCGNYHRLNSIDFSVMNVRRVARQVAQSNPSRSVSHTSARRMAMALTSNKTYEGDYNKTVAQLIEQTRECTSSLSDVMSVIWVRIRDSKGVHWKHGLQALQVLRNLLYHGPMAAIAEATDGLDKIRSMKFYNENMRAQICTQIRQAAHQVYNLLVDRTKLFHIRRICANKRRLLIQPQGGRYAKERRISITHRFGAMHQLLNPSNPMRVAPAPHSAPSVTYQASANEDIFGLTTASQPPVNATPAPSSAGVNQDLIGLFGNFDVSDSRSVASTPMPNNQVPNAFDNASVASGAAPSLAVPTPAPAVPPQNPFPATAPATAARVASQGSHIQQPPHVVAPIGRNMSQGSHVQQPPPAMAPAARNMSQGSYAQQAPPMNAPGARNMSHGSYFQQPPPAMAPGARNMSQGSHAQQAPPSHAQQGYAIPTAQPRAPTASLPPQQSKPMAPPHYQQPGNPSLYASTNSHPGLLPQQQYNQGRGQHIPQQQYHHQHPQHQQPHPPPAQQQYMAQQAPPAQPKKPNLAQFDPFR